MTYNTITLQTPRGESAIYVGDCREVFLKTIEQAAFIVVDDEIPKHHQGLLPKDDRVLTLSGGESVKDLRIVETLYARCLELGLNRGSLIVGIGGGTICDLTGFVAATYLRGLHLALIPSTLLSQVDASIGGKNGVNFAGTKNLIGTIRQPEICICDTGLLRSLPREVLSEGYAEVIKHAALASEKLFSELENKLDPLSENGSTEIISSSILVKKEIVEADELESGDRMKLNLGHTIGHAIEATLGISHGSSVAVGMLLEHRLAELKGICSPNVRPRLTRLLERYELPTDIGIREDEFLKFLRRDKKRFGATYSVPLLREIGQCELFKVTEDELRECLKR